MATKHKNDTSKIDLPKFYARFAETKNASATAREFGLSRYVVNRLWDELSEDEREKYGQTITKQRNAALAEHSEKVKHEIKDYAQRVHDVRMVLLEKLENCILKLKAEEGASIARIKDASTALKNLSSVTDDASAEKEDNILLRFAELQKIRS